MTTFTGSHLRFRITGALLALALLVGPIAAQVSAAERCHAACEPHPARAENGTNCCPSPSAVTVAPERGNQDGAPAAPGCEGDTHYCGVCTARPLFLAQERPALALDPARALSPAFDAVTSASRDVPFAIFHPPRA